MRRKMIEEYRINKKGAECFRTRDREEATKRLADLQAKKPNGVYTLQSRDCCLDRRGFMETDPSGKPCWSIWR